MLICYIDITMYLKSQQGIALGNILRTICLSVQMLIQWTFILRQICFHWNSKSIVLMNDP